MADFGLKVSRNGTDAKLVEATDLILTSKYPLAKIDSTKAGSFKNVRIQFNNNVPLNVPTVVYQFKHGYNYTPSIWSLCRIFGLASPYLTDYNYIIDDGPVMTYRGAGGAIDVVYFWAEADATNVYYYVNRIADTTAYAPTVINVTIAGVSLRIRTYVFVEDVNM